MYTTLRYTAEKDGIAEMKIIKNKKFRMVLIKLSIFDTIIFVMKKKITFFVLFAVLIVFQFVQTPKNESNELLAADITKVTDVPEGVQLLLTTACYDCHSNNTVYPWYRNIQPLTWWLNNHITEGKQKLNFSEFGSYDTKKAKHKFSKIAKVLEENEMPLFSYTLLHRNAKLDDIQKKLIVVWAKNTAITYGNSN